MSTHCALRKVSRVCCSRCFLQCRERLRSGAVIVLPLCRADLRNASGVFNRPAGRLLCLRAWGKKKSGALLRRVVESKRNYGGIKSGIKSHPVTVFIALPVNRDQPDIPFKGRIGPGEFLPGGELCNALVQLFLCHVLPSFHCAGCSTAAS